MKIRFATLDDIPAFIELARTFHSLTRFKAYDYNAERVANHLRAVIENPKGAHCFFVAVTVMILGAKASRLFEMFSNAMTIPFGVTSGDQTGSLLPV